MLLGGVDVACQFLIFHPVLLCYPILLEKNYSTLMLSFDRGLILL